MEEEEEEEEEYIWGASGVMYRARKKDSPLAIDEDGFSVVGNATVNLLKLKTQPQRQTKECCKLHFGNQGGFHVFPTTLEENGEWRERERERKEKRVLLLL